MYKNSDRSKYTVKSRIPKAYIDIKLMVPKEQNVLTKLYKKNSDYIITINMEIGET